MKKQITFERYINGKLVIHKPLTSFFFTVCCILHMLVLCFFAFASVSYAAYITLSPYYTEKTELKYTNSTVKNLLNMSAEYDNNTSTINNTFQSGTRRKIMHKKFSSKSVEAAYLVITDLVLLLYFNILTWMKSRIIKHYSKLNAKKVSVFSEKRTRFLQLNLPDIAAETEFHISKLLSDESLAIFSDLNNLNLLLSPQSSSEIYFNLKRFMFHPTWSDMRGNLPPFIDIVLYMKDILNGVQYLHDHNIYHLNLCPENILIVESMDNESGMAKIGGFEFSRQSDQRMVEYQNVGLQCLYRPPEYFSENWVNAAKVDYWSIGVIAYEVLTGGMLTIEADKAGPDQRCDEIIMAEKLMKLSHFSSAVEACWNYTNFIGGFNDIIKIDGTMYNLSPSRFLEDSWSFVNSLMHFDPNERVTPFEALEAPFFTRAINPKLLCSFRCFIQRRTQIYLTFLPM